jgi:hypothetical protein
LVVDFGGSVTQCMDGVETITTFCPPSSFEINCPYGCRASSTMGHEDLCNATPTDGGCGLDGGCGGGRDGPDDVSDGSDERS